MKQLLLSLTLLYSTVSFANANEGSASWVTEAGIMLIEGTAAKDLYQSLDSVEVRDPLSTNYDELRTKENKFAKCEANFYRFNKQDGDTEWVIQDGVKCQIKAPKGTVINQ